MSASAFEGSAPGAKGERSVSESLSAGSVPDPEEELEGAPLSPV
ncbi:hypothetical protein [Nonomuraea recticatena]